MARSREHIDTLRTETATFMQESPLQYRRVRDNSPSPGWAFYISWKNPVPGRLGAIIGDALTNMRAALDHLATQLSYIMPQVNATKRVNFPIIHKAPGPGIRPSFLNQFPHAAAAIVESVQPYQNATLNRPPEIHPLYVLNVLVNADKHEALTVVEMFGSSSDIRVTGLGGEPIFGRVETPGGTAADKVGWLPDEVFSNTEPWEIVATIEQILAIDVGNRQMFPIVDLLMSIHKYLQEQIVYPLVAACSPTGVQSRPPR